MLFGYDCADASICWNRDRSSLILGPTEMLLGAEEIFEVFLSLLSDESLLFLGALFLLSLLIEVLLFLLGRDSGVNFRGKRCADCPSLLVLPSSSVASKYETSQVNDFLLFDMCIYVTGAWCWWCCADSMPRMEQRAEGETKS